MPLFALEVLPNEVPPLGAAACLWNPKLLTADEPAGCTPGLRVNKPLALPGEIPLKAVDPLVLWAAALNLNAKPLC